MNEKSSREWAGPDWKDASAYLAELSDEEWRWQFLRRGHKYCDDWELATRIPEGVGDVRLSNEKVSSQDYGLAIFIDPRIDRPDSILLTRTPMSPEAGNIDWTFNIFKPIKPQLKAVEQILKGMQDKAKASGHFKERRNHNNLWKDYLRVLDAHHAEVTYKMIGRQIFGKEDDDIAATAAKKAHNKAKALTQNPPL